MPTFQFDPATGQGVQIDGIQEQQAPEGPAATPEEIERFVTKRAAQDMANRARYQDITQGEVSAADLDTEVLLAQVQQKLYRNEFANSLEQQALINQAEELAAKLVGGSAPSNEATDEPVETIDDSAAEIAQNERVQKDLAYAGEVMSEELVTEFNEVIGGDDELSRAAALDTLKHLRQTPQHFVSREDSTGISADTERMIASEYGDEIAHAISILGNAVAQGVISPTQAIKTASSDPSLQRALFNLASKNVIKIAL